MDPAACRHAIWRIEYRAGKDLLKDTWNIRTWEDLFARFGDLCRQTGSVIRYTEPSLSDQNRARWPNHPIWEIGQAEIASKLFDMTEGADPNPIKQVIREQHISTILKGIRGNCITLAALEGIHFPHLSGFFHQTGQRLADDLATNGEHLARMLENARERYEFVERERERK
ncbi:hypothetical protein [Planktotalea sp.]|uniref:hypothetical protein n=1 Tax=Planktotalea sp. TaxID=2029877 RepID=UPI003D6C2941